MQLRDLEQRVMGIKFQFITADNIKMLLTQCKDSEISPKPLYPISCYYTYRKAICESPMWQQENPFMQQDGEIDRRQNEGIRSDSLQKNAWKRALLWKSPVLRHL
jgi:hypothetical protein